MKRPAGAKPKAEAKAASKTATAATDCFDGYKKDGTRVRVIVRDDAPAGCVKKRLICLKVSGSPQYIQVHKDWFDSEADAIKWVNNRAVRVAAGQLSRDECRAEKDNAEFPHAPVAVLKRPAAQKKPAAAPDGPAAAPDGPAAAAAAPESPPRTPMKKAKAPPQEEASAPGTASSSFQNIDWPEDGLRSLL